MKPFQCVKDRQIRRPCSNFLSSLGFQCRQPLPRSPPPQSPSWLKTQIRRFVHPPPLHLHHLPTTALRVTGTVHELPSTTHRGGGTPLLLNTRDGRHCCPPLPIVARNARWGQRYCPPLPLPRSKRDSGELSAHHHLYATTTQSQQLPNADDIDTDHSMILHT